MLVLHRKPRETLVLTDSRTGHSVTVTVMEIGRGYVRIGIDAPKEVNILRGELAPYADPHDRPKGD